VKGEETTTITSRNVFPEYYLIYVEKFEDMIHEDLDEWVYFFKHGAIREDFKSPGIQLAAKKLDYLAMGEKERRAYDGYLAYLAQERDILDTAKEEGREEGRKEGMEKGERNELIKTVTKQLTKKFGLISDEIREKIKSADSYELELITENIFEIETPDEVLKYLN
jgi:predicted transposase YdaD